MFSRQYKLSEAARRVGGSACAHAVLTQREVLCDRDSLALAAVFAAVAPDRVAGTRANAFVHTLTGPGNVSPRAPRRSVQSLPAPRYRRDRRPEVLKDAARAIQESSPPEITQHSEGGENG